MLLSPLLPKSPGCLALRSAMTVIMEGYRPATIQADFANFCSQAQFGHWEALSLSCTSCVIWLRDRNEELWVVTYHSRQICRKISAVCLSKRNLIPLRTWSLQEGSGLDSPEHCPPLTLSLSVNSQNLSRVLSSVHGNNFNNFWSVAPCWFNVASSVTITLLQLIPKQQCKRLWHYVQIRTYKLLFSLYIRVQRLKQLCTENAQHLICYLKKKQSQKNQNQNKHPGKKGWNMGNILL